MIIQLPFKLQTMLVSNDLYEYLSQIKKHNSYAIAISYTGNLLCDANACIFHPQHSIHTATVTGKLIQVSTSSCN